MMLGRPRNRLTQILASLDRPEEPLEMRPAAWTPCRGWDVYQADRPELRERAWRLAYESYLQRGYADVQPDRLRILLQDALPETATFMVESNPRSELPLATVTVVPDSPLGLPMDRDCPEELGALRAAGKKICEVAKLAVRDGADGLGRLGNTALLHLFRLAYLQARRMGGADYLVASVIPKHARFYRKMLLFEPMGEARSYGSVRGTTGVPLRLDLSDAEERYRLKYGHRSEDKNLYRLFINEEEPEVLEWMRSGAGAMSEEELRSFMVERTDLLERATPAERMYLQGRYLACDFDRIFLEASVVPTWSGAIGGL